MAPAPSDPARRSTGAAGDPDPDPDAERDADAGGEAITGLAAPDFVEMYRVVAEGASDAIVAIDVDSRVHYANPAVERIFGWPPEELVGQSLTVLMPPDLRPVHERALGRYVRTGERHTAWSGIEFPALHRDGSDIAIEVSFGEFRRGDRRYFTGIMRDVTARTRDRVRHEASEQRFRALAEHSVVGIWQVTLEGRTLYMNPTMCSLLGIGGPDEIEGEMYHGFFTPESITRMRREEIKRLKGLSSTYEVELAPRGERQHSLLLSAAPLLSADGSVESIVGAFVDITERKAAVRQLERQALQDSLTGLPNRVLYENRLVHALDRARRTGGLLAVLFLDVDRFKVVNDSLGHSAGDMLLMALAERFGRCLRQEDTLARFGGDEFAFLLEEVDDESDAISVAERIAEELAAPVRLAGRDLHVSASIGIAVSTPREHRAQDLLRYADMAMYEAKGRGGGTAYHVFDETVDLGPAARLQLESELRVAVDARQFEVHFQPVICLESGRIRGFEALVRWRHPERGLVSPGEFIDLAEETNLIVPLGRQVLDDTCRLLGQWRRRFPEHADLWVSVNLSGTQMQRTDMAAEVTEVLEREDLPPGALRVEITETSWMKIPQEVNRLKALGVRIAIDDFGTGHAVLDYLKTVPADTLKIDRTFVAGFGSSRVDTAIVKAVVALALELEINVTAEGIETAEQWKGLRELGCNEGQGYYFSPPLPAAEAAELLATVPRWG